MVHPYLRRRQGAGGGRLSVGSGACVLERTLGVPIFQEQVIKLAMVAAGFTPGEADQLRRDGGVETARRSRAYQQKLMDRYAGAGYRREFAERSIARSWVSVTTASQSHAASFALLVYVSAWLKCHHPAAFCAALINSLPMGFYAPAQLVRDARGHGVTVLPGGCEPE